MYIYYNVPTYTLWQFAVIIVPIYVSYYVCIGSRCFHFNFVFKRFVSPFITYRYIIYYYTIVTVIIIFLFRLAVIVVYIFVRIIMYTRIQLATHIHGNIII